MPLHLLGKKSWNVYNPAAIARVKADEAAAAAREAAEEQRMQEVDAARRAAILRGQTPPPLPDEESTHNERRPEREKDGRERKRRRLHGEDDTDRDIRLARVTTGPKDEETVSTLKLRRPESDAPLTDHAGNINLFPIDLKEAGKREKNEEAEKERKKKERAFEDQYTMRFSNAAGQKGTLQQPWYATADNSRDDPNTKSGDQTIAYAGFETKDVWGNTDPRRKEREQARMASNDPLAFMNKAQVQLKKSKADRKKWAEDRDRELRGMRLAEEREHRRERHTKRRHRREDDDDLTDDTSRERHRRDHSSKDRHRQRSHSHDRRRHDRKSSHRDRKRSRSRSRSRDREHHKKKDDMKSRRNDRHGDVREEHRT
ncbi:hypothetical protein BU24DRAFT_426158 [Aaosphaeria arxii CBS 175.79]|uniref:CBF1-interacting co-repressor CIR N-terminal domain-containing protein n=1 Tax=Aaosphaeria arxii CBS 175.79 TaxID=1450172 RepID=A0A6A5XHG6_9PLEO|nr:uncharacterized protein BU24DRAFT_426158 [Aaosphaeria arxii CBS 175.79]KAF2012297.1 hypothetical protein BU24DRAFT_426158 [Aaosphaeria arxii CBS 175.79]